MPKNEASINETSDLELKSKAFQLFFYALLYSKNKDVRNYQFESGIYSLRSLTSSFLQASFRGGEITLGVLSQFEEYLKCKISELFNIEIPFRQTDIPENCKYCNFKSICNK